MVRGLTAAFLVGLSTLTASGFTRAATSPALQRSPPEPYLSSSSAPAQATAAPGRFKIYLPVAQTDRAPSRVLRVSLDRGRLSVVGTPGKDDVILRLDPTGRKVEVDDRANGRGTDYSFELALIQSIEVVLGAGNDSVIFDDTNGSLGSLRPLRIDVGDGDNLAIGSTGKLSPDEIASLPVVLPRVLAKVRALGVTADALIARAEKLERSAGALAATEGVTFTQSAERFDTEAQAQLFAPGDALSNAAESESQDIAHRFELDAADLLTRTAGITDRLDTFRGHDADVFGQRITQLTDEAITKGDDDAAVEEVAGRIDALSDEFAQSADALGTQAEAELSPSVASLDGHVKELEQWNDTILHRAGALEVAGDDLRGRVEKGLARDRLDVQAEALAREAEAIDQASDQLGVQVEASLAEVGKLFEVPPSGPFEEASSARMSTPASGCSTTTNTYTGSGWISGGATTNDLMNGSAGADFMFGLGGNDEMHGNGGNDWMFGNAGDDCMFGEADNDRMFGDLMLMSGNAGKDRMDGGDGRDLVFGNGADDTLNGDDKIDLMFGNAGDDTMHGNKGETITITVSVNPNVTVSIDLGDFMSGGRDDDTMYGDESVDFMMGGGESDTMHGDDCMDFMWGNSGTDTLSGDAGKCISVNGNPLPIGNFMWGNADADTMHGGVDLDFMWGNDGADTMNGDAGTDFMWGDAGTDTMNGDAGVDFMWGNTDADTMNGDAGTDFVWGNDGDDVLHGNDGADLVWGNAGNDTMNGDAGIDFMWGNTDIDTMSGDAGFDFMWGNEGDDTMNGNDAIDFMWGNDGDDVMHGNDGTDFMWGNAGCDTMNGDAGLDFMWGNTDTDTMQGDTGADFMWGNEGDDTMNGNDGSDFMWGNEDADTVRGDAGTDFLWGNTGNDCLAGGADIDFMWGNEDNDTMNGESGTDAMWGNDGTDTLYGGDGNDLVWGNQGNDALCGNDGDDFMWGGDGDDTMHGDADNDFVWGNDGADTMYGGSGKDLMIGNKGNDALCGNDGNDFVWGNDDDDRMDGGPGNDFMWGNDGADTIFGSADNDTMFGNQGDDTMYGGPGNDWMFGNQGDDTMYGGPGNDWMFGNQGADTMYGGSGSDFVFGNAGNDTTDNDGPDSSPFPVLSCASTCVPRICEATSCKKPVTPSPTPAGLPNTATPTPRLTSTPTPRPSATLTATSSPTPAGVPTSIHTPTPTPRPSATATSTLTPTPRPTSTSTPRPSATATSTLTPTPRPTSTMTPRPSATSTTTLTPTPRPTSTPTPRPSATPTSTLTSTSTPRPTSTMTPRPSATSTTTRTPTVTPGCVVRPAGLAAWWGLDELSGTTAFDGIGGNNGVVQGGALVVNPAKVFAGRSFDGTSGRVVVASAPALNAGTADLSIDAWIRPKSLDGVRPIVTKQYAPVDVPEGYAFYLDAGQPAFAMSNGGSSIVGTASVTVAADGQWHLVAVTIQRGSTTGGRLYLDGALIHTFDTTPLVGTVDTTAELHIAERPSLGRGVPPRFFNDGIDEVELFHRALSAAEVHSIYTAGNFGKCDKPPTPSQAPRPTQFPVRFRTSNVAGRSDPNVTSVTNSARTGESSRRISVQPFAAKVALYSFSCRMSSMSAWPPGLRTRAISRTALARSSAAYRLWMAARETTTSNVASGNESCRMSSVRISMRSATPSRSAFSRAASGRLPDRSSSCHRSMPVAVPVVRCLAAPMSINPRPQPTSRTRSAPVQAI